MCGGGEVRIYEKGSENRIIRTVKKNNYTMKWQ